MKLSRPRSHYFPVTGCLPVRILWITAHGTLTPPTTVLLWEMLMRKTLRAFWMSTSSGSWRRPAVSLQGLTATLPSCALQTVSQDSEGSDSQARVNIQPGMVLKESRATYTITGTCITITRQVWESPKSRWGQRQPHVHSMDLRWAQRRIIMVQSLAALQMVVWDPTLWNIQGTGVEQTLWYVHINTSTCCAGCLLNFLLVVKSRSGTQCKRAFKRAEEVRPCDVSGHAEEVEKNQKILLWLMEGQKEMVQHKRSPYGSVISDFSQLLDKGLAFLEEKHVTGQRSYYVEKWQSCGSLAQTLKIMLHLISCSEYICVVMLGESH